MKNYKNVVIEKNETGLVYKEPVHICYEHDYSKAIGWAYIGLVDGMYVADFVFHDKADRFVPEELMPELYPSIGYTFTKNEPNGLKRIYTVGLCKCPNVDETILQLKHY
jgi:hypothetical protein